MGQKVKSIYYALCPLPVACLIISRFIPGDTATTPVAMRHPFDWLMLAIIMSPVLSLFGMAGIAGELNEGRDVRGWIVATVVAALPILFFLASTVLPK